VDVHGDIGRRAHQQGTKFQERKEPRAARRTVPARPGGNAGGEAKVGGDVTGIREDLGACPDTSDREATAGDGEWQDGASERPTTDGYRGEAGDRATSDTS
jgi:hypothetical protein